MSAFPFKRLGTVGVLLFTAQDTKTLASIPETPRGGKNKAFNQEQRALGASHISASQASAPGQPPSARPPFLVWSGSGRGCSVPHPAALGMEGVMAEKERVVHNLLFLLLNSDFSYSEPNVARHWGGRGWVGGSGRLATPGMAPAQLATSLCKPHVSYQ